MDADSDTARRRRLAWTGLWILLAAGTFALFAHRAWFIPGTDAEAYYRAGARVLLGEPLYRDETTPFKYLPPVALLFVPFAWLPFQWARMAMFLVSWTMGAWLYRGVIRNHGNASALFLFAVFARFHNYDFLNLQINHWTLLLFCLFLAGRERRPWASAFCLSLTVLFKLTPALVLLGLLRLGRGRELLRVLACGAVLLLLPLALPGPGWHAYADWLALMRATTPWPAPDFPIVQSVQSGLWFALHTRLEPWPFLILVNLLLALALGLTLRAKPAGPAGEARLLCALAVLSVIFSPLAWKHHYLMIWPAFLALLVARQLRAAWAGGLLLAAVPSLLALFSREWADRSYVTVLGAIVIWAAVSGPRAGIKKMTFSADKPGT